MSLRGGPSRLLVVALLLCVPALSCSEIRLALGSTPLTTHTVVSGSALPPADAEGRILALLLRMDGDEAVLEQVDSLTGECRDYVFLIDPERCYWVVAFQDPDGSLTRDPGEPAAAVELPLRACGGKAESGTPREIAQPPLHLQAEAELPFDLSFDLSEFVARTDEEMPLRAGQVVSLDDELFSEETGKEGMWASEKAGRLRGAGVYFMEPYDPARIPVLFVHGIGGTPRDFRALVESLDPDRFQAWLFHYPSGKRLRPTALALSELVARLNRTLEFDRLFVIAHSMGGLVARSFVLQTEKNPLWGSPELLVTLSTPWAGHDSARLGARYAPGIVPAWVDLQPESEFLLSLREPLPEQTAYFLLFGFNTGALNPAMAYSHDGTVSVASQLAMFAQESAVRSWGFDLEHTEILSDPAVLRRVSKLLAEAWAQRP